jgi:hypothetical protein
MKVYAKLEEFTRGNLPIYALFLKNLRKPLLQRAAGGIIMNGTAEDVKKYYS